MKKILLTGTGGYIGGLLFERLKGEYCVTAQNRHSQNFSGLSGDYDIIIHAAATSPYKNPSACDYLEDNITATMNLIKSPAALNSKKIIYLSTTSIYGDLKTDIVDAVYRSLNPSLYAISKYFAEELIRESGLSHYILRLPGIAGGASHDNWFVKTIEAIAGNKDIRVYNTALKFNNVVYISDLCDFIEKLCRENKAGSEIFTLGAVIPETVSDIIKYAVKKSNSSSKITDCGTSEKYFTISVDNAAAYGYKSKSIFEMIDLVIDWQRKNGVRTTDA